MSSVFVHAAARPMSRPQHSARLRKSMAAQTPAPPVARLLRMAAANKFPAGSSGSRRQAHILRLRAHFLRLSIPEDYRQQYEMGDRAGGRCRCSAAGPSRRCRG